MSGRARVVDQYVTALMDPGVEIRVLTDYQGVREEWFASGRQKATALVLLLFAPRAEPG